jgi:biotin operon repressor
MNRNVKEIELNRGKGGLVLDVSREDVEGGDEVVVFTRSKEEGQRIGIGESYWVDTFIDGTDGVDFEAERDEGLEPKYRIEDEWFMVHGWMASQLKLSGNELLIYAIIYSFNMRDRLLCSSQDWIAAKCGCSRKAVNEGINRLVKKGLVLKVMVQSEYAVDERNKEGGYQQVYTALVCKRAFKPGFGVPREYKSHRLLQATVVQHKDDKNGFPDCIIF